MGVTSNSKGVSGECWLTVKPEKSSVNTVPRFLLSSLRFLLLVVSFLGFLCLVGAGAGAGSHASMSCLKKPLDLTATAFAGDVLELRRESGILLGIGLAGEWPRSMVRLEVFWGGRVSSLAEEAKQLDGLEH